MTKSTFENIDELWDFGDPKGSEARFRELLEKASLPKNAAAHVEILTQIARAQGVQRKFDEARATLDAADALLIEEMIGPRIRVLLERGRVLNSSGDAEQSCSYFLEAFDRARDASEAYHAVDAAHMLGIVTKPTEQLEWNLKALELAEAAPDPRARRWLGALYNNIGWTYHDLQNYEKALELLTKALAWYEANGTDRQVRVGKWSIAKIMRLLGKVEEALEGQRAVLAEWDKAGEEDGYVEEELGECLLALGHKDEASGHFAKAYNILSNDAWLSANEPERLERLGRLSGRGKA